MRISDWSSDVCSSDLVVPALAVILTAALMRAIASLRKAYRVRGTTNLVSGMPNLEALRQVSAPSSGIIVAARIKNYAQITTSLEPRYETELLEQIVARRLFGTSPTIILPAEGSSGSVADREYCTGSPRHVRRKTGM